jgi:hypothetical protein
LVVLGVVVLSAVPLGLARELNMPIGPDVLVFISATRALLQSLGQQPLTEEERAELECCLRDLAALLESERQRPAA